MTDERTVTVGDFLKAAQPLQDYQDATTFSSTHIVLHFKGFYNLSIKWNEGFVRWETKISRKTRDNVRIEIEVKTATEILKLIGVGFDAFVQNAVAK